MENNNFEINLADMNEVFNNKTFKYRINGFVYACRMKDIGILGDSAVLFDSNGISSDGEKGYFISVNKNEYPTGKTVTLTGRYEDLHFTFINYYNKEKLDKKIVDLPFSIVLTKPIDGDTYRLEIETVEGMRTKFAIYKYREFKDRTLVDDIKFYANVLDFSKILKLVKSFVYNPVLFFNTYNEIGTKYQHTYTYSDLSKAAMQDENLDKPMGKLKKMIKRITNND